MDVPFKLNKALKFLISFFALFILLYGLNYFFVGLTIPGGYYNEWIANHVDYVSAYRSLILNGASIFTDIAGFDNYVNKYELRIPGISRVRMVYSCIGFNILSFWLAFTLAYPQPLKKKLLYCISGIFLITLMNMMRVAGLAMIRSISSLRHTQFNHHMLFNIIVYAIIFMAIRIMVNDSDGIIGNKAKVH